MAKDIQIATLTHRKAKRRNVPTAELEAVVEETVKAPVRVAWERRNRDLDPQLVWRGKDEQEALILQAPPLYIQEKIHPKVLIDALQKESRERRRQDSAVLPDLFADFNGLPDREAATEFYQHDANWTNRMILGDSLHVMASLAEREGLRGQVQCIYLDPPYGIRFNSNFQWSTTSRDVKDGARDHLTREPEQVKAFRDTWRDGIHSYLSYLRDRLTVARDLLHESGSIFVQIGDENVHRVRALMDEVFGEGNCVSLITIVKTSAQEDNLLSNVCDFILWYARSIEKVKFRQLWIDKSGDPGASEYNRVDILGERRRLTMDEDANRAKLGSEFRIYRQDNIVSQRPPGSFPVRFESQEYRPITGYWKTGVEGFGRLIKARRIEKRGKMLSYVRFMGDFPVRPIANFWTDVRFSSRSEEKTYVVQTSANVIQRCILMATDPGDLVLDPTCGSGTTATVAEQWGRRWITIDTSRVALALARARVMGARYPWYILADSPEGQRKEAEVTRGKLQNTPTHGDLRHGFVYERVPHITLKAIAGNEEIDRLWEKGQETLEPLRADLNAALGKAWEEWDIPPREAGNAWPTAAATAHAKWWEARIHRQKAIDAAIAARAEFETLFDRPYGDASKVRVAGPFTVESPSPHRVLTVDADDELIDPLDTPARRPSNHSDAAFTAMILENLMAAGVQQAHREDRLAFTALTPAGRASALPPKGGSWKAKPNGAPACSSVRSSAPCIAPTWWPPPAKPPTPASTC